MMKLIVSFMQSVIQSRAVIGRSETELKGSWGSEHGKTIRFLPKGLPESTGHLPTEPHHVLMHIFVSTRYLRKENLLSWK